jgi:hypothetical protein
VKNSGCHEASDEAETAVIDHVSPYRSRRPATSEHDAPQLSHENTAQFWHLKLAIANVRKSRLALSRQHLIFVFSMSFAPEFLMPQETCVDATKVCFLKKMVFLF